MSEGGEERADEPGPLEKVLVSPWMGMGLVVSGVVTGLLGSIYTDELKKIILVVVSLTARRGANLFFALVLVTGAAVFFRQRAIDAQRAKVQKRFDAAADEIPELIRTLPEPAFQNEFGIVFEKIAELFRNIDRANADIPTRAQAVTVALQGFATLASQFDAGRRDDRFAANLMVYITGEAKDPWRSKLRFFRRNPDTLAGVLALPAEFAALAETEDAAVPEFALPIPKDIGRSKKEPGGTGWRVLPGAPFAMVRNQFEHYSRTSELKAWCDEYGDFLDEEKTEMTQHFAKHADEIGGFLCIPIRQPSTAYVAEDERREPLGVLNIHWNRCDRLCNAHSAQLFAKATYPLQVLVAQMLVSLLAERQPLPNSRISATPPPEGQRINEPAQPH